MQLCMCIILHIIGDRPCSGTKCAQYSHFRIIHVSRKAQYVATGGRLYGLIGCTSVSCAIFSVNISNTSVCSSVSSEIWIMNALCGTFESVHRQMEASWQSTFHFWTQFYMSSVLIVLSVCFMPSDCIVISVNALYCTLPVLWCLECKT